MTTVSQLVDFTGAPHAPSTLERVLTTTFAPLSSGELASLVERVRVTRVAAGDHLSVESRDELAIVVVGVVDARGTTHRPGEILPAGRATALREVVIAHLPHEALAHWSSSRVLQVLRSARTALETQPLLVGITAHDPRLATELLHTLEAALEPHGTVSVARIDGTPSRLELADRVATADFQLVHLSAPDLQASRRSLPVDRWLHVVDGARPREGRAVPARTLVLAHDRSLDRPRNTAQHLDFHGPEDHLHWRRGHVGDRDRLARELAGVAVGFCLGAGGIRGFAHLGVLRAAEEAGIPVDRVSGTSIGAVFGALVGLGYDAAGRHEASERLAKARPFGDFTIPTTALLRGERFERLAREFFAGVDLADLWIPLVTKTCELSEFQETAHRRGPLEAIVLAGCALPGVVPPRILGGKVHVDGGAADMLPVALLQERTPGPIIAVDVSPWAPIETPRHRGSSHEAYPAGFGALVAKLRGESPLRALEIFWRSASYAVAARSRAEGARADLLIVPDLARVGTTDLEARGESVRLGYEAGTAAFVGVHPKRLRR